MNYREVEQDIARSQTKDDIRLATESIFIELQDDWEGLTNGDIARTLESLAEVLRLADTRFKEIVGLKPVPLTDKQAMELESKHHVIIDQERALYANGEKEDFDGWHRIPPEWITELNES